MTSDNTLTVGVYQPSAGNETPQERLERLANVLEQPASRDCDLLVCPELYMSGYLAGDRINELAEPGDGAFARGMCDIARRTRCAIVCGYPERTQSGLYNAALCAGADGLLANHRKNLLPYDYEERYFQCGQRPTVFDIKGWKIGMLICYEVEFPEAVRHHAQAGCHLVVAPTALTDEWTVVARRVIPARAFENNIFVAYSNYAGQENGSRYLGESVIVSPTGEDLVRAGADETVITTPLDRTAISAARSRLRFLADVQHSCYR